MNRKLLAASFGLLLALQPLGAWADDDPALAAVVKSYHDSVQARVDAGKRDEKDYADLLQQADDIIAKHPESKNDQLAQIVTLKSEIYLEVLTNADRYDKAIALVQQAQKDFPDTRFAQHATNMIAVLQKIATQDKIWSALTPGSVFPDFNVTDFEGKPLSVAAHKGHVVLIDFWATWCTPCMMEFPNVKKTYDAWHDKGLDIIGINLDDKDGKDKVAQFIKSKGADWPQYYDGKAWDNDLVVKYGVHGIPATVLLDADGKVIGKDLHGEELQQAVAKAMAKGGA